MKSVTNKPSPNAPPTTTPELQLEFGFQFTDLYRPDRLQNLSEVFYKWLAEQDGEAAAQLKALSEKGETAPDDEVSDCLIAAAPHLESFLTRLFGIEAAVQATRETILADDPVFEFKKIFVKKRVLKKNAGQEWTFGADAAVRVLELLRHAHGSVDSADERSADERSAEEGAADEEMAVAQAVLWMHEVDETARKAAKAGGAAWTPELHERIARSRALFLTDASLTSAMGDLLTGAAGTDEADAALAAAITDGVTAALVHRAQDAADPAHKWVSLHKPHKQNFDALVPLRRAREDLPEQFTGELSTRRERVEPFALTDTRMSHRAISHEVDYCLYCHDRDKDSCSKGLRTKTDELKKNPLGVTLGGCPLYEKISEMHLLRKAGGVIGPFAVAALDNPMMPGTGHRICNDCMKGCVFQVQEPVNIPAIETQVLVDVLTLPWGFEIYSLLTRWNPLNVRRPSALPYNGKKVLVVGLGPAGYTLCHHLMNEGFGVVGVDGLKLEPLSRELVGSTKEPPKPIYDYTVLKEPLEKRVLLGFGGVSEYGITVRWDKTFLSVIYLNLLRRNQFRCYGGIRFGGTLTVEDAWEMGFDHVAIAAGAGKPTYIRMENNLIRGVRKASDFLMNLQLTGAYKRDSLANLQVRLPAIVIGGGLTAIDTATEMLAYYVVQAERTAQRYRILTDERGEDALRATFSPSDLVVLDEVRGHGDILLSERALAADEGRTPRLQELLDSWGGVSIVYRRRVKDSPAYRLNHEEVTQSLEEGVRYVELLSPTKVVPDEEGSAQAVEFDRMAIDDAGKLRPTGETRTLPARTVAIAAGTSPNTGYEAEYPGTFELGDWGYFKNYRAEADLSVEGGKPQLKATDDQGGFFTSYNNEGRLVSYYGDNHPKYAGSVVKAMASAKDGHRAVADAFAPALAGLSKAAQPERDAEWLAFGREMNQQLMAVVEGVHRLAPGIVEVVVKAPLAARKFEPGQFYRLQNYEVYTPRVDGVPMLMEGIALTGASVDKEKGLLSTIALEMGTSSRMLAMLNPGQPVVLMGPTGEGTKTPGGETVLLCGGGLGNAVLFSIARQLKERGSRVIYFAGYRDSNTLFKREEIERACDQVIWSSDMGEIIEPHRPQDAHYRGNIVQAMVAYQNGEFGSKMFDLRTVDRLIVIGSDRMMKAVRDARSTLLQMQPHVAIGSINSPMQCMLKAVCAQCLQKVRDPETGEESVVYICSNQDQPLDAVDFEHLHERLTQNSAQEKLSNLWFDRLLDQADIPRV